MERKFVQQKITILMIITAFLFCILGGRLLYLQLFKTHTYKTLASENLVRIIPIRAPRGKILDRNGRVIVDNRPEYNLSLSLYGRSKKERRAVIESLAGVLAGDKNFQRSAAEWVQEIEKSLQKQKRPYIPVTVASGVSWNTVVEVRERRFDFSGVMVEEEPVRRYPHGDLLAHAAGYVQQITGKQLKEHRDEGYRLGDLFGQAGIEMSYEKYLRGKKGARKVEVDAYGRPVNITGVKDPVPGSDLVLTVDRELQKAVEQALAAGVKKAQKEGHGEAKHGAAVVLNVNNGAVQAMASYPSYQPRKFTGELTEKELKNMSFLNRAISPYPPGSVFKPVTGAAILENEVVDPGHEIYDPGYYKYGDTRFNDWKPGGHGRVDFRKALKVSCNTYFFKYGKQVGHTEIARYAREFGLGQKTGIDLPGERAGVLPTLEYKHDRFSKESWEYNWHTYDTLNMAIGQGYNRYTPLQLANYVAAIANGGTLYEPYMVRKVISPAGEVEKVFTREVRNKVDVSPENLQIIREGMHMVTQPYGTAWSVFRDFPLSAAAKTGSAEVSGHDSHALFVSFVPYENPEIALAVVIEHGGSGGAIAGPVARDILNAYLKTRPGTPVSQ